MLIYMNLFIWYLATMLWEWGMFKVRKLAKRIKFYGISISVTLSPSPPPPSDKLSLTGYSGGLLSSPAKPCSPASNYYKYRNNPPALFVLDLVFCQAVRFALLEFQQLTKASFF